MQKTSYREFIKDHITHCDISYRGGILKVDVSELFPSLADHSDPIMGASQNYLGGGIAGRITAGSYFDIEELTKKEQKIYHPVAEDIKKYFFELNNGGGDDYMQENYNSYARNQNLSVSGY